MNTKLKTCLIYGEDYKDKVILFKEGVAGLSNYQYEVKNSFGALVKTLTIGDGLEIVGTTVCIQGDALETISVGIYSAIFWFDINGETRKLFDEDLKISNDGCDCANIYNLSFTIVPVELSESTVNIYLNWEDLTPAQIQELQQPALDAAVIANTAADNANTATSNANTATTNANNATTNANNAANNANNSAQLANDAADSASEAANEANDTNTAVQLAENARVLAENERVAQENDRQAFEDEREDNEDERILNESDRVTAESTRDNNENSRQTAENNRVTAENTRIQNESTRLSNWSNITNTIGIVATTTNSAPNTQITTKHEAFTAGIYTNWKDATNTPITLTGADVADNNVLFFLKNGVVTTVQKTPKKTPYDDYLASTNDSPVKTKTEWLNSLKGAVYIPKVKFNSSDNTEGSTDLAVFQFYKSISDQFFYKGKQLFYKDTDTLELGYLTNTGVKGTSNHNIILTIPRSRIAGNSFVIKTRASTVNTNSRAVYLQGSTILSQDAGITGQIVTTHTIPANCDTIKIHLSNYTDVNLLSLRDNPLVNEFILNEGSVIQPKDEPVMTKKILKKIPVKNLVNPANIALTMRHSAGGVGIVNAAPDEYIGSTGMIAVKEGEFYAVDGTGINSLWQGGYYAENTTMATSQPKISNITFAAPVTGTGKIFQVPTGLGIKYALINLNVNTSKTAVEGTYQVENGEMATAIEPYTEVEQFNPDYLPKSVTSVSGGVFNSEAWFKYTNDTENSNILKEKAPVFAKHWLKKDKDLNVVATGTSLFARSAEHCTNHEKEKERPPLMHSNNAASILWDKMKWDNQFYRRYDFPSFFTEIGSGFNTSSNIAEWDDGLYRQGWTRYTNTANSGVSFKVPVNAWQFNFIFRTDSLASENVKVTIAEGAGKMEVFNGTSWVEAHNYTFSMRESAPVTRTVSVPKASDDTFVNRTIASKGNTTYQKRLKMRCKSGAIDSRATEKNVTIQAQDSGRFLYWGVEWSPREYMITYINAARGSHNTQAENTGGLPKFADNEVWGFKPDLMFFELPIHNDGAANGNGGYTGGYWGRLTNNYVFRTDYELSMKTRSVYFGLNPEIVMFSSALSTQFNAMDTVTGELIAGEQLDGKMMTGLDKFDEAYQWVLENHPEVGFIHSCKTWCEAGSAIFGNLYLATVGSGRAGRTFTNEGGHWNDSGSKIIAKTLVKIFNFE